VKKLLAVLLSASCAVAQQPVALRNHLIIGGTASPTLVLGSAGNRITLSPIGGTSLGVNGVAVGMGGGGLTLGSSTSGQVLINRGGTVGGGDLPYLECFPDKTTDPPLSPDFVVMTGAEIVAIAEELRLNSENATAQTPPDSGTKNHE